MLQRLPGCVPTCLCTLYIFVILTLTCTVLFADTMLIQSAVFTSVQVVKKIAGGSAWPETKREMMYGDWNTTRQWE